MPGTLNQGNDEEKNDQSADQEVELTDGFKFDITPAEAKQLSIENRKVGDECKFIVTAEVLNAKDGSLTFQAKEIEWVYDEKNEPAKSSDMVGASPMYKAGMGQKKDKNKISYVRPTTEPYVS